MAIQDEFAFIEEIKPKKSYQSTLVTGIGDDAAIYKSNKGMNQIICADTMVEEIHFSKRTMSPFQIGYKALAVNISDIAAMGGNPTFYLVSIAIPEGWSQEDLVSIYKGMESLAAEYQVDLIGGDTVSTHHSLLISVTVIGEVENDKLLLRSNAKAGDIVFVTGTLGDSAAGLELLLKHGNTYKFTSDEEYLTLRHQFPSPRIANGRFLATFDRVSLNDISDGIASEANEIAEASNVSIILNEDLLPLSSQLKKYNQELAIELALFGGEDFELIGTMSEGDWRTIPPEMKEGFTIVGKVIESTESPKVLLKKDDEFIHLEKKGYNHFKK